MKTVNSEQQLLLTATGGLQLLGRLDFVTVPALIKLFATIDLQKVRVIDCSAVTFCDNAGIAMLIFILRRVKLRSVQLQNMPEQMCALLRALRLDFITNFSE